MAVSEFDKAAIGSLSSRPRLRPITKFYQNSAYFINFPASFTWPPTAEKGQSLQLDAHGIVHLPLQLKLHKSIDK